MNTITNLTDILNDYKPYKVYSALLTQTGTTAPTAVVLENTLGVTPTFGRTSAGLYTMTDASSGFTSNLTSVVMAANGSFLATAAVTSTSVITLGTLNITGGTADAKLASTLVEVKVYNA